MKFILEKQTFGLLQILFRMSHNTRKSDDVIEPIATNEKRTKIESNTNDLLRLNDTDFSENDYQAAFRTIADKLINCHELVVNEENCFRLSEIEFYFYHHIRHADTFAHRHPEQEHYSNWYFHRQGTSTTASYKAGTYKYNNHIIIEIFIRNIFLGV